MTAKDGKMPGADELHTSTVPSRGTSLDDVVKGWLADHTNADVEGWRRLLTGNSRATWAAELVTPTGRTGAIVRRDEGAGPMAGTELTLAREAAVYRALDEFDPAVPRLLASDARTVVLTRLSGKPAWSDAVLDDLLLFLARLHQRPVDHLDRSTFTPSAAAELDLWRRIAESTIGPRDPVVDIAFDILHTTFPGEPERLVLCHGDAGVGNVLVEEGRLSGVVDWEFAHVGDPIDDLAWVTVRAVLNGVDLPGFEKAAERYAAVSGVTLDSQRLGYWQAVVILRNLVCCAAAISAEDSGQDKLIYFMLVPSLRSMLMKAVARVAGVDLPAPAPAAAPLRPLPGQEALAEVSRQLNALVDELTDPEQVRRGKRMRLLLSQLADTWPLAAVVEQLNIEDEGRQGPEEALEDRLRRLAVAADRELQLFPKAARMAQVPLAGFAGT